MKLAIYLRSLKSARGAEQVSANIARGLAEAGHQVDFLVEEKEGRLVEQLEQHENISVIDISMKRHWRVVNRGFQVIALARSLVPESGAGQKPGSPWRRQLLRFFIKENPPVLGLLKYIRDVRPSAVLSFLNYPNLSLLIASLFYRSGTRYIVNVRNHITTSAARTGSKWVRSVPNLMRRFFPRADAIIAPSSGVAEDVEKLLGIPGKSVAVIHNPVYRPEILELSRLSVAHEWFIDGSIPVVIAAGKLKPQKDFDTLLKAFARLRQKRPVRLIILGEGAERIKLEKLILGLGISDCVDLHGYVENPYPYFRNASVFVLSSAWEGLPNVLIEAMACGCPVVATDCPSGPREILQDGRIGFLVPVGDTGAMADAIDKAITSPADKRLFVERARDYSYEKSLSNYESVLTDSPLHMAAKKTQPE